MGRKRIVCPTCGSRERVPAHIGVVRDTEGNILSQAEREGTIYQSGCIVTDTLKGWLCSGCDTIYLANGTYHGKANRAGN